MATLFKLGILADCQYADKASLTQNHLWGMHVCDALRDDGPQYVPYCVAKRSLAFEQHVGGVIVVLGIIICALPLG